MHKFLILIFSLTFAYTSPADAQPNKVEKYTVSEVLKTIKGEWRQQYKIIDGEIFYDRRYFQTPRGMMLAIDTTSIHTFQIDPRGRTQYTINWEEPDGQLKFEATEGTIGSWDLKQGGAGVELIIRDAYFEGCPEITRRVIRINNLQLLVMDLDTGDHYYFTRR